MQVRGLGAAAFLMRSYLLLWPRNWFGETMFKNARAFGIVTLVALACFQTGPALAYGPYSAFALRDSVNAMGYFRVLLGPSRIEAHRTGSFGFLVKRELQFAHPAYQRGAWAYSDSPSTALNLIDFGFGLDGKFNGFGADILDALRAKSRSSAVTEVTDGTN